MVSYPSISLNTDTALLLSGLGLTRRGATAPHVYQENRDNEDSFALE